MKKLILFCLFALTLAGCSRVEQGHIGIRQNWDKTIEQGELTPGVHSSVFSEVIEAAANEVNLYIENAHPLTADKTTLSDLDLNVMYTVEPNAISELYSGFKARHVVDEHKVVYVMQKYLVTIINSAVSDAVGKYKALEANDNRKAIETDIRVAIIEKLKEEKLDGKIKIGSIIIKNLAIDPALTASNMAVIKAANEYRAKEYEVKTAQQEANRMEILAKQSGPQYVEYMKAQSQLIVSQGLVEAMKAGRGSQTIIIPADFKGFLNVGK
ncbi:SPFH domain / Band 7 family protein [compost metagenome]